MCFQALKVAGQVAGSTISTSPLPYNTLAGHCEALGSGTRQKLSNWLIHENHYTRATDKFSPAFPADSYLALEKVSIFTYISSVDSSTPDDCWSTKANLWTQNMYQSKNELCFVLTGLTYLTQIISSDEPGQEALMPQNACTAMKLPPASPFHNFL